MCLGLHTQSCYQYDI